MKKFIVAVLCLSSFTCFGSNYQEIESRGNGTGDLIDADFAERRMVNGTILRMLTQKNGQRLKEDTLLPIMRCFLESSQYLDRELRELRQILTFSQYDLYDDIYFSHIKIGECRDQSMVCTGKEQYADIIIDETAINESRYGVTVAELVALISHQHIKHMVGDFDEPYYSFSRYVRDLIQEQGLLTGYRRPYTPRRK